MIFNTPTGQRPGPTDPPQSNNSYGVDNAVYDRYTKRRDGFVNMYRSGMKQAGSMHLNQNGYDDSDQFGSVPMFKSLEKQKMFQDRDVGSDLRNSYGNKFNSSPDYWDQELAKTYDGDMGKMINSYGAEKGWAEGEYDTRKYKFSNPEENIRYKLQGDNQAPQGTRTNFAPSFKFGGILMKKQINI